MASSAPPLHMVPPSVAALAEMSRLPLPANIGEFKARQKTFLKRANPAGLKKALAGNEQRSSSFFSVTYPRIVGMANRYHHLFPTPIEMLQQGTNGRRVFTREQCACLLSNCFLSTMGYAPTEIHPTAEMSELLEARHDADTAKLNCFLNYFECVTDPGHVFGRGVVEVWRVCDASGAYDNWDAWTTSTKPIPHVEMRAGGIESSVLCVQADFANKYIGGGVISGGCVQEEIRFAESPELCVAMLICPRMQPNEAILMHGVERYSITKGYAFDLGFDRSCVDDTPRDSNDNIRVALTAMDAFDFRFYPLVTQYQSDTLLFHLRKAYVAFGCSEGCFDRANYPTVATGNWGCGAFRGKLQLMAVVQLIAAGESDRALVYHPFNQHKLATDFAVFIEDLRKRNINIGQLATALRAAMAEYEEAAASLYPPNEEEIFTTVLANIK